MAGPGSRPAPEVFRAVLLPTVLDMIGDTPVVDVSVLAPHPGVRLLAKLEGQNPFGSLKDRIAKAMLERAVATGSLAPGQRIVTPSSGNTGIALAGIGCITGHPVTVVMPDNASPERSQTLAALGADVLFTPARLKSAAAIRHAERLAEEYPEWCLLNQYDDEANPTAHFETTGPEVWRDVPEITHFVAGIGSGGTILGVGRFLRTRNARIGIVAAEPASGRHVEGVRNLGDGYVPPIFAAWCGHDLVEEIRVVDHAASLHMTTLLARQCGIFAGPSSGMALAAALDVAAGIDQGTIVFLACDGGWKYLSTSAPHEHAHVAVDHLHRPEALS